MIKLLFVEDDERAIRHARSRVLEEHQDVICDVQNFGDVEDWLTKNTPDIISLDLLLGGLSGEAEVAGQEVYNLIWKSHFCPIIVYSAQPDAQETERPPHPFLRTIKKGKGSPEAFSAAVNDFRPHVDTLRDAEQQVRHEFSVAMRDLAPSVFENISDAAERHRIVTRSGRRRLAAQMDDFSEYEGEEAKQLAPWEHYLCPPVSDDLLLGDILQETDSDAVKPESFRIVLTPSCDLVASGERKPKVQNVLVAKCITMKTGLTKVAMGLDRKTRRDENRLEEYKKILKSSLSQAFIRNIVPFPKYGSHIPTMAADLRQLDLVEFSQINGDNATFQRVASIDSPFRELISWAYMQTACRPGLPDRNIHDWCEEIVALYSN
ncbi:hypothetical protein [uncultured Gimesia sp.]|uniref:hypothetical protein n=1 Tax=uncultured Gimesia sp. TaxID=1678688 RepID=UPI0030DBE574|tara:strand:+ start:73629 stop:74762 length:1134 start_codon:yes stop_codon:yes gene_type:complete